jgi:hypothetical protein
LFQAQRLRDAVLCPAFQPQRAGDLPLLRFTQVASHQVHPPGVLTFLRVG